METQIEIRNLTDMELKQRRALLPKYTNDCTPEQLIEQTTIWTEQDRRYRAGVAEYNRAAEITTGLKHGDRVSIYAVSFFGIGGEACTGKVIFDKNGRLAVKLNRAEGSGRKIIPISKSFKKII